MMIPRIPEREVATAKHLGLRETDIQGSWSRYAKWTIERFGDAALLGGDPWSRWAREDAVAIATNRDARAEAKDLARREDEAYRREAMSFGAWADVLVRKAQAAVLESCHEAAVARGWATRPEPKPRQPAASFATLMAFGEWSRRQGPCTCERCRTVAVVDHTGRVVRRRVYRDIKQEAAPRPRETQTAELPLVADDATYAARRAQSIVDLHAEFPESEFTSGLELNP